MSILLALLLLLLGLLQGQTIEEFPDGRETEITVSVGETVEVHLGDGNDSIGHNYFIVDGEHSEFAKVEIGETDSAPGCQPGGCYFDYYLAITGQKPGTFDVVTQYCSRSTLENCDTLGEVPVVYTITVVE